MSLAIYYNNMVRKHNSKMLGSLEQKESAAVALLEKVLISAPFQALPRTKGRHTFDRKVCDKEIGFILSYEQVEGSIHSIDYCYRI